MAKTIETLVEDVYAVLTDGVDVAEQADVFENFGQDMAAMLKARLADNKPERKGGLRLSALGHCETKQWYHAHGELTKEELRGDTLLKFLYGDVVEELLLTLVRLAGHKVSGEQDTLDIEGIKGHRDCVIDGYTVDVKTASSYGYNKFKDGSLKTGDDPFGYMYQISSYFHADETTNRDGAYFLTMEKSLGKLCLLKVDADEMPNPRTRAREMKAIIDNGAVPPPRPMENDPVPHNKGGNLKLCVSCSYCDVKQECWADDANKGLGLRTFLYRNGPVHLTHVEEGSEPNVPEVA